MCVSSCGCLCASFHDDGEGDDDKTTIVVSKPRFPRWFLSFLEVYVGTTTDISSQHNITCCTNPNPFLLIPVLLMKLRLSDQGSFQLSRQMRMIQPHHSLLQQWNSSLATSVAKLLGNESARRIYTISSERYVIQLQLATYLLFI